MSYDLLDARGRYLGTLSIHANADLREYVLSRVGARSECARFWRDGIATEPQALTADLARLTVPKNRRAAAAMKELIRAARRAERVLVLSNGC